jgi:ATP-dependent DNA ligase
MHINRGQEFVIAGYTPSPKNFDALGVGHTADKMKECRWLGPKLVGQFEFVEWTGDGHPRHPKFIVLRYDKKPEDVRREKPVSS